jgi:hypothetical protein
VGLFVFLVISSYFLPLQENFLGGGMGNYINFPYLWSWINFDGEHYLSVVQRGYQPLTYFYFPAYPLLVRFFAGLINQSYQALAATGLVISNTLFWIALFGIWKLVRLDYKKNVAFLTVALLLVFPTSFYFGSFYTESMFLTLVVWSFYFARRKRWIVAGLLGAIATATRVVGMALIPALVVEIWLQGGIGGRGRIGIRRMLGVVMIPIGLVLYMVYLNKVTGDPLDFFHSVSIFGEQRSSSFVLLPQVFYRYVFKIFPNINYDYFPVVFATWLEFLTAVFFGGLLILGIVGWIKRKKKWDKFWLVRFVQDNLIKMRLSYLVYFGIAYIIPTLSGSFSSMPRYVLVLFPAFIQSAVYLSKASKVVKYVVISLLFIGLGIATSLFVRGYWVS